MLRDALKDALKDLRSQLRGRKASAYILEIQGNHEKPDGRDKEEDDDDNSESNSKRSGASASSEAIEEGLEGLRSEMKSFMSKRKSDVKARPVPIPFNVGMKPSKPQAASVSKMKGKVK